MLDPTRDQGTPIDRSLRLIDVSISYHPAAFGLTARGDAALTLQRLKRQLLTLDAEDRAWWLQTFGQWPRRGASR